MAKVRDEKNLDIYGNAPIPWSRPLAELEKVVSGPGSSIWIATTRPDGRPHVAGVGAIWLGGNFYIVSGPGTRKSRNLAENPNCVISVGLPGIDLVVEEQPSGSPTKPRSGGSRMSTRPRVGIPR